MRVTQGVPAHVQGCSLGRRDQSWNLLGPRPAQEKDAVRPRPFSGPGKVFFCSTLTVSPIVLSIPPRARMPCPLGTLVLASVGKCLLLLDLDV